MSEGLLTVLKFCFLALLFLFLVRVVRVVALELRAAPLTPVDAAPAAKQRSSKRKGSAQRGIRVVEPAQLAGQTYAVDGEITVGRATGCGIVLSADTYASQIHARVFRRDDDLYVEDLGSTNGTFVNGTRISTPVRVRRGDRVQFGQTIVEPTK